MTAVFLATREEPTRDRASEYRLAASRQPRCLPQRVCRHVTPVSSECSKGSRGAPRDPTRDGAHEIVNEWCNDGLPELELGQEKPTKRAELHRRRARPHSKPSPSQFSPRHGRPLR